MYVNMFALSRTGMLYIFTVNVKGIYLASDNFGAILREKKEKGLMHIFTSPSPAPFLQS